MTWVVQEEIWLRPTQGAGLPDFFTPRDAQIVGRIGHTPKGAARCRRAMGLARIRARRLGVLRAGDAGLAQILNLFLCRRCLSRAVLVDAGAGSVEMSGFAGDVVQ